MSQVTCFTCLTLDRVPQARVLAETLRAACPGWVLQAVVMDQPQPGFDPAMLGSFDRVMLAAEPATTELDALQPEPGADDRLALVRARTFVDLLATSTGAVIYLDAGMAAFPALARLTARLDDASIVLTPRWTQPGSVTPGYLDGRGQYDLGCLAVANDAVGNAFANWWVSQALAGGAERACDAVPSVFDRVLVQRDPGVGVAEWNLAERRVWFRHGDLLANDSALSLFNFGSGEAPVAPSPEVFELWRWYQRRLAAHGVA